MSNNLNGDRVTEGQANKEITINNSVGAIDAAITEVVGVDMTAGATTVSPTVYAGAYSFVIAGAIAAAALTLPAQKKSSLFTNNTTVAITITVGTGKIVLQPNKSAKVYTDGTANGILNEGAGSAVPVGGTTGQVLTKNSGTDGDAGWVTPVTAGSSGVTLPTGGAQNQVLRKESGVDGDAVWTGLGQIRTPYDTPHRYWRIKSIHSAGCGDTNNGLAELEFHKSYGSASQLGGTAIAGASGVDDPSLAFDGNEGNRWYSPYPFGSNATNFANAWIGRDFGTPTTVTEVLIGADTDTTYPETTTTFNLDWSDDGTTWTTVQQFVKATPWVAGERDTFQVTNYVTKTIGTDKTIPLGGSTGQVLSKVSGADGDVGWVTPASGSGSGGTGGSAIGTAFSYYAIEMFASASNAFAFSELVFTDAANATHTPTSATSTQTYSGSYAPSNAFDGNQSTSWCSTDKTVNVFMVAFAAPFVLASLSMTARNDGQSAQTPSIFSIAGSNDGITSAPIADVSTSWSSNGQTRTFAIPALSAGSGGSSGGSGTLPDTWFNPPTPANFTLASFGRGSVAAGITMTANPYVGTIISNGGDANDTRGFKGLVRPIPSGNLGAFTFIARIRWNGATKFTNASTGIIVTAGTGGSVKQLFVGKAFGVGGNTLHGPYAGYWDGSNFTDLDYGKSTDAEWFKIVVTGTVVSLFVSQDAVNWQQVDSNRDFGTPITHFGFMTSKYDGGHTPGSCPYYESTEATGHLGA